MATNVSPEYKKAEAAYRKARDTGNRLSLLKDMLRLIPKHKGTEHLQADIKTRIKQATEELASPRKGGARGGPVQALRPEGAAQVALIGPPNAGKSSLHVRLTGSQAEVGPYPFTTHAPLPGMLPFEDVHFQLVDLPPISADYMEPWILNALQPADAALLVVDLSDPECLNHIVAIRQRLDEKRVTLDESWPLLSHTEDDADARDDEAEIPDPFRIHLPTILVANKSDLDPDPDELEVLEELLGVSYPGVTTSAKTGAGLDGIGPLLFGGLGIIRVYTKAPGKDPDHGRPFTLRAGSHVHDLAGLIHKDIAAHFQFARIWGSSHFDGQQVGPDYALADKDIVEIHA